MLKNKYCYLCLFNNKRTINIYKTDLQYIYENLADIKIRDRQCWLCYICHTRLRQCHCLKQLAIQTRGLVNNIFEKKINMTGTFGGLLKLEVHNETAISVPPPTCIKQEVDVKMEPLDDDGTEQDEIECAKNEANDTMFYVEFEDPLLVPDTDTRGMSNADRNDTRHESTGLDLKAGPPQSTNDSGRRSHTTHTITEEYLEGGAARFADEQGTEEGRIKQEIDERVRDTVTISDIQPTPQNWETSDMVDRDEFIRELQKYYSGHNVNSKKFEWTRSRIERVIKLLDENSALQSQGIRRSNTHYHHVRKYDVMNVGSKKMLIIKRKDISEPVIQIIPTEEYYDKILEAHVSTGHGRRDKVVHTLKDKYVVPIFAVTIFLNLCKTCMIKRGLPRKAVVKPTIFEDLNRRGQIELVDLQSSPDGDYKWLLQYQDLSTKFCFLRPLKSKQAKEVAIEILKIFLEVGCPHILQCDDGHKFIASVLKEVVNMWPTCKILIGRRPQSQGSEELADVKGMIEAWMAENQSTNWSVGCYFVQLQKNSTHHSAIGRTPFIALFGQDPKLGLASTCLPKDIISKVETEEDIEKVLEDIAEHKENSETNEADEEENVISKGACLNTERNDTITAIDRKMTLEQVNIETDTELLLDSSSMHSVDAEKREKPDKNNDKTNTSMEQAVTSDVGSISDIIESNCLVCNVCDKELSEASVRTCRECKKIVHRTCGVVLCQQDRSHLMCNFCVRERNILDEREPQKNLKRSADAVISTTSKITKDNAGVGSAVLVEVPKVDNLDFKNMIGKVLMKKDELYKVGLTKDWMPKNFLSHPNSTLGDISKVASDGQGTKQCNCKLNKYGQCMTLKCKCKKTKVPCNTRCHSSVTCNNM